jgi:bifunctional oligoribonuclease and PAP phosphatase NrnA
MTERITVVSPAPPAALLDLVSRRGAEALMLGHVHPDADVLGTLLALGSCLETRGWSVTYAGPHAIPASLAFLPGAAQWQVWTGSPRHFELIVLTDCPNDQRTEGLLESARAETSAVLNVDHHPDNRRYGTVNWLDPTAAATGEMVFDLIQALGDRVTPEVALNLFTAIHTDTGSFRYSNTTAKTFRIAAELTAAGANPAFVSNELYQRRSRDSLGTLGEVLRLVQVSGDGQIAWLTLPRGIASDAFVAAEDLVTYPRTIDGVKVALLLLEERDGVVKVSLRGKGEIAVNRIAHCFGGGGHDNAAGCTVRGTLDEVTASVLEAVREALDGKDS